MTPLAIRRLALDDVCTELAAEDDPDRRIDEDPVCLALVERYGSLTLEHVGTLFRLTRERIRQIETRAMRKVRITNPDVAEYLEGQAHDQQSMWEQLTEHVPAPQAQDWQEA